MSPFIRKDSQQQGPFTEKKILEADEEVPTSTNFWQFLFANGTARARLARAKAYREKLQFIDLKIADYRIGKKAFAGDTRLPGHEEVITQLIDLQIRLTALEQAPYRKPTALVERGKGACQRAVNAAKVQAFKLNRLRLLIALGAQLRQAPHLAASLLAEINSARAVHDRIEVLDAEIKKLKCRIPSTATTRVKPVFVKMKILLLSIAGVSLCLVVFSLRSLPASVPVPPEVWKALPGDEQKILRLLRESGSGILLVQKLLDYGAEGSHQEKTQVVDVTPLTYKAVNGKDYVAIAVTQRFRGVTQRVCYVLDLKAQEYYVLSEKNYDTFIASGNVALKDGSPFAAVVLVYAIANHDPSTSVPQATPTLDPRKDNLAVQKNDSAAQATPAHPPVPYGTIVWSDWHHHKQYPTQWYGTYRAKKGTSNLGNGTYKHYLRVELEDTSAWISLSNISCNGQVILSFGLPAGCDLGGGGFADQSGTTFEAEDTLDHCEWYCNVFIKTN